MDKLRQLAEELDSIDAEFKTIAKDRSDPIWGEFVKKKDTLVDKMYEIIPQTSDSFPLSSFLLSPSFGHQTVAVTWIRYKKDSTHLHIICYMLLNISSNFIAYHILCVLHAVMSQCDYEQSCQIRETLLVYSPPEQTTRYHTKRRLLQMIEPKIEFSIDEIVKDSYWWKDVESKFFNSLAGILQYRLVALQIIRNKQLFEQFHRYRSQLGENHQTFFVYHGSTPDILKSIAQKGFLTPDMLPTLSNKVRILDKGYFGRGIYQGFAADYAIHYSEVYRKSNEILLSMIAPGRSYIVKKGGEKLGQQCEPGFDSHVSPENKEIILFRSEQILPLFIIRFQRIPNAPTKEEKY